MITSVRSMVVEDLPAVLAIEAEANPSPWRAGDFSVFFPAITDAPSMTSAGGRRVAWVYADPEVRGFLCAVGAADEVELQSIAVERVKWSRGLGSSLMEAMLSWTRTQGYRTLHLEVRESNFRASEFYGRWGFARVGRRDKYYGDNGEAAVLMSLTLEAAG